MTRGVVRGLVVVAALVAGVASAEVTRELRFAIPASGPVVVENLAGTMKVVAGDRSEISIVATVHAESEELAAQVQLTEVDGKAFARTVRVVYPTSGHRTFRYPQVGRSNLEYGGKKVTVSGTSGVLLWAEVAVAVPQAEIDATFRNLVGALDASGVAGKVLLDTASGDIHGESLTGSVTADTGSGDVTIESSRGALVCDTGSGDCDVRGFDGSRLRCDTGSGGITLADVTVDRLEADTGSGDVRTSDIEAAQVTISTGSGDVVLGAAGARLRRASLDTGSGDVEVRLPADAAFELTTDIGSGDLVCRFADARAVVEGRTVVGYARGSGGTAIAVDTGSGSVLIVPAI